MLSPPYCFWVMVSLQQVSSTCTLKHTPLDVKPSNLHPSIVLNSLPSPAILPADSHSRVTTKYSPCSPIIAFVFMNSYRPQPKNWSKLCHFKQSVRHNVLVSYCPKYTKGFNYAVRTTHYLHNIRVIPTHHVVHA